MDAFPARARPSVEDGASDLLRRGEASWLQLVDEEGRVGQGEAMPLPEFGTESLDTCEQVIRSHLKALADQVLGRQPGGHRRCLRDPSWGSLGVERHPPAPRGGSARGPCRRIMRWSWRCWICWRSGRASPAPAAEPERALGGPGQCAADLGRAEGAGRGGAPGRGRGLPDAQAQGGRAPDRRGRGTRPGGPRGRGPGCEPPAGCERGLVGA